MDEGSPSIKTSDHSKGVSSILCLFSSGKSFLEFLFFFLLLKSCPMFVAFACVAKFVYISYNDRLENVYVWSRQSRVAAVLFFCLGTDFCLRTESFSSQIFCLKTKLFEL